MADHGARVHAEYAPSAAYRWMRCRGSLQMSRGVPSGKSSIYAEEGTQCHEAADHILADGWTFEAATEGLSDEQKLIVEEYVEFCRSKHNEAGGDKIEVYTEARMHAPGISPKFFGTGDFAIVNYTRRNLRFIDLKAGAVPVYVRDKAGRINPQLGSYLLLMLAHLGASVSRWDFDPRAIGIETMTITIVQPKVYDRPQSTRVEIAELQEFLDELCEAIDAIEAGDTTLAAGDWCKFCPAKGACPELRRAAVRRAKLDFAPEKAFPFDEWAGILAEAELIQAHVQGIRAKIRAALEQGHRVPGFKLVTKRERSVWLDETASQIDLQERGLPDAGLFRTVFLSPAAAKKLAKVHKVTVDWTEHVGKVSGGLTIVPDSDPRPAVVLQPGMDFADEDDDNG
jgi:hypothetical protein